THGPSSIVSRMIVTSPGVALEPQARLSQQLRRHGQVVLGGGNTATQRSADSVTQRAGINLSTPTAKPVS
ncbi:hypothetical protein RA280_48095, partial [Cupriavidus sp. CV2]|uniref:hypothetical protein n=1 Tax=Cupriavidus ulmosensis TaxID=3065913 RepID=UPI00296B35A9